MNDLAEKALLGARAGYVAARTHPMRCLGMAGFAVGVVAVVAGGQVAARSSSRPLTAWLGLASSTTIGDHGRWPSAVLVASMVALALLWQVLIAVVRRRREPLARTWAVAGAWALPFVLGPPLPATGGTSVYSYLAYGRLARGGHDPYEQTPLALGTSPVVSAIDPALRGYRSSSGALGTDLAHLVVSVSGGRLLGALLIWRAIGVVTAFAIGRAAVRLASRPRSAGLVLCAANPIVLVFVVSSPHLEAVTVALLLGSVVAARRRSFAGAILLATLAGSVTTMGFVALPLLVVAQAMARPRTARLVGVCRDVGVAAVVLAAIRLAVPDGFGWWRTSGGQFDQHTPFAIADAVGRLIAPVVRGASYDDLAAGGRLTAAVAALAVVGYLLITCRARSLEANIGFALLALALLAPVLHPWYLMWGVLVLAPTATGQRRTWVVALSVVGCVLTPPGFGDAVDYTLTGIALGIVAAVAGAVLIGQDRASRATAETPARLVGEADARSATAGDLAYRGPDIGEVDAGHDQRHE